MRRLICAALVLCFSLILLPAYAETGLEKFTVYHGNREDSKIAITMDDCIEREWVWKTAELCRRYGITVTFFPNGYNLKEDERENWLDVLDAGCEIGSHGQAHEHMDQAGNRAVVNNLGRFQQTLDEVLGFHYQVRWFRPPFGKIAGSKAGSRNSIGTIRKFGYDHILMWDVSFSPGFGPENIMKDTKAGSIILFHARKRDYECLEAVIPQLLEKGFEPVTVSSLFGFPPPETGEELYVYDRSRYMQN